MKITAKNIAQQSIKFREKIQEDIKKHIVKIRADIIKHIIIDIINHSPVKTGTYINSHTLCINGMLVRKADIYISSKNESTEGGRALNQFMSNEYQRALDTDVFDRISIVVPSTTFFHWGVTYVEPEYLVYSRALHNFSNRGNIVSALVQTAMAVMRSSDEDIVKHRKKIKSKKEKN